MANLQENVSLKNLNSYRVDVNARFFIEIDKKEDLLQLKEVPKIKSIRKMVLGDGTNTLFVNNFDGLIIKNNIKGKKVIDDTDEYITVKLGAGGNWHDFVTWAVENGFAGVENMALIPGSIGAAPAQNIAAYGQNQSDTFDHLTAFNLDSFTFESMGQYRCNFRYRASNFKTIFKDKLIITDVTYKLNKFTEKLETDYHERKGRYGSLEEALKEVAAEPYGIKDVYNAVIYMRKRRLPDPNKVGTVGSFFVNPVVSKQKFEELSKVVDELQHYPLDRLMYSNKEWEKVKEDFVKVPAARFIDERGWKGKWINNVACSPSHALCIISNGKASGKQILEYAELVKKDIWNAYGIKLESEVNIVE